MIGILGLTIQVLLVIAIIGSITCFAIKTFKKCKTEWKKK